MLELETMRNSMDREDETPPSITGTDSRIVKCEACDICLPAQVFPEHLLTVNHAAKRRDFTTSRVLDENERRCYVCCCDIPKTEWSSHVNGSKHALWRNLSMAKTVPKMEKVLADSNVIESYNCSREQLFKSSTACDESERSDSGRETGITHSVTGKRSAPTSLAKSTEGLEITSSGTYCKPCGEWFTLTTGFEHVNAEKHRTMLERYGAEGNRAVRPDKPPGLKEVDVKCKLCVESVKLDEWAGHVARKNHLEKVHEFEQSPLPSSKFCHCTVCFSYVRKDKWNEHEHGRWHIGSLWLRELVVTQPRKRRRASVDNTMLKSNPKTNDTLMMMDNNLMIVEESMEERASKEDHETIEVEEEERGNNNVANPEDNPSNMTGKAVIGQVNDEGALIMSSPLPLSCSIFFPVRDGSLIVTAYGTYCRPCKKWVGFSENYSHVESKRHRKCFGLFGAEGDGDHPPVLPLSVKTRQDVVKFKCRLCNEKVKLSAWREHITSDAHNLKLVEFKKSALSSEFYRRCETCHVFVEEARWDKHTNQFAHQKSLLFKLLETSPTEPIYKESLSVTTKQVTRSSSSEDLSPLISPDGSLMVTNKGFYCKPCRLSFVTIHKWFLHSTHASHKKLLRLHGPNGNHAHPRRGDFNTVQVECRLCKINLSIDDWVQHFNGEQHYRKCRTLEQIPLGCHSRCNECYGMLRKNHLISHRHVLYCGLVQLAKYQMKANPRYADGQIKHDSRKVEEKSPRKMRTSESEVNVFSNADKPMVTQIEDGNDMMIKESVMKERYGDGKPIVDEDETVGKDVSTSDAKMESDSRVSSGRKPDESASFDETGQFVFCHPCRRWFRSVGYWNRHKVSEGHKKEVAYRGANGNGESRPDIPASYKRTLMMECHLCGGDYPIGKWVEHATGKEHGTKAERFLRSPLPDSSQFRRCQVCALDVKLNEWQQHIADRMHRLSPKKRKSICVSD